MRFITIFSFFLLFSACKSDRTTVVSSPATDAENAYNANPDNANANKFIDEIMVQMQNEDADKAALVDLATKGLEVAEKFNLPPRIRTFLFYLIKEDYANADTPNRILALANQMSTAKRPQTANILYRAVSDNFTGSEAAKTALAKGDPEVTKLDNYLVNIGEGIFKGEVNKIGINRNAALKYVDACEAYALGFPNAPDAPSYLFRAAEIAKSIQTYPKLMSLYDWIINKYPNYEKTPTTFFLKGFVLENDLKNNEKAEEVYNEFLKKYPKHDLVDDVQFLLENINKSDEEIRQLIEQKQEELKKK